MMDIFKGSSLVGLLSALALVALPFVNAKNLFYGTLNGKYFFIIIFAYVVSLIFAYQVYKKRVEFSFFQGYLLYALVALLVVSLISVFFGIFPGQSLASGILRGNAGLLFLVHLGIVSFFTSKLYTEVDWKLIRYGLIVGGSLYSFMYFFGPEGLNILASFFSKIYESPGTTFGNSTFAGAYITLTSIFTLIAIESKNCSNRSKKILAFLFIIQILNPLFINSKLWLGIIPFSSIFENPFTLFGTAKASAVVIYTTILYLVGYKLIQTYTKDVLQKRLSYSYTAIWAFGVTISLILLFTPGSFIQNGYIKQSSEARILVWESAAEAIKEKPFFGWGLENFSIPFTKYFNNELYLKENFSEIWFDKAHNFFFDLLVSVGLVGAMALFIVLFLLCRIFTKAATAMLISRSEAHLLCLILFAHILQLQTAFDTIPTYFIISLIVTYGLWLERKISEPNSKKYVISNQLRYGVCALLLVAIFSASIFFGFKEHDRQYALYKVFAASTQIEREKSVQSAVSNVQDFESLRLVSASLTKGVLSELAKNELDPDLAIYVKRDLVMYQQAFENRLEIVPSDYRSRMNLVYIQLVQTMLGDNKILESQDILKNSSELSPSNPLAYILEGLSYLYEGKFEKAKEIARLGIALNPSIEISREVLAHIEAQEKSFPVVEFFKLTNL